MQACGIYGFDFTQEFAAHGLTFHPITSYPADALKLARHKGAHRLTGTVTAETITANDVFHLAGVLSFIEQLDVHVSEPTTFDDLATFTINLPTELDKSKRNSGVGSMLGRDAYNPYKDSRRDFIHLAMAKLNDEKFIKDTKFTSLLFKAVETFRQRSPYYEITYYLMMSGLESHCRAVQKAGPELKAAPVIAKQLKSYGFDIFQDQPQELQRAVSSYLHIRNALFHQGDSAVIKIIDKEEVHFNAMDYLYQLCMLTNLTILKAVDFDDKHTSWDAWIDRMLH